MNLLPVEILGEIARVDMHVYNLLARAMPAFARSLTVGRRVDYMIHFGYTCKVSKNKVCWRLNGWLHRADGPAKEYSRGNEWYWNGMLHREGGPAVIKYCVIGSIGLRTVHCSLSSGCYNENNPNHCIMQTWCRYDMLHREDGPAVVCKHRSLWYINGKQITPSGI